MTDTLRGACLMVASMACFSVEDAIIKGLSGAFASAQIIWMLGLGGAVVLGIWQARDGALWSRHYLRGRVLLRTAFEAVGSCFFVSSLALLPLTLVSAILQATPLVVALGAVLFLGEAVGWRRWLAIGVGFLGVLAILRPGAAEFEPATLLAVAGMAMLAGRDLVTRRMPADVSGLRVSLHAFAGLVPAGLLLQNVQGIPILVPDAGQAGLLVLCVGVGIVGYLTIVAATRLGEISVVSSFRYSRMVFALLAGGLVFGERPDGWTLLGAAVVIGSGVFTLLREARVRRRTGGFPS